MARLSFCVVLAAVIAGPACTDVESPTDLHPEGPPMIMQVFLDEEYDDPPGSGEFTDRQVLGYGTHPNALTIKHQVLTANPDFRAQRIRVVLDELLVGNFLEEIACRSPVDDDAYAFVPLGATPDDIARCAEQADVLPQTCTGDHAVCLDPSGVPVGVLDENGDGAADDLQFIRGSVGIQCGSIEVPIDVQASYWQPSGNQQVPAAGSITGVLGPAVLLRTIDGLPTGKQCQVKFGDTVVDKGGERPCAPQWGPSGAPDETAWPPAVPCPANDTSAASVTVAPLHLFSPPFQPEEGGLQTFDLPILLTFNAKISVSSVQATLVPAPPSPLVVGTLSTDANTLQLSVQGGLARTTDYTLTVTLTDLFGGGLAQPFVLHFTTD